MLCEKCKKNEANFHITRIINGVKEEQHLCEICAKENNTMIWTFLQVFHSKIY